MEIKKNYVFLYTKIYNCMEWQNNIIQFFLFIIFIVFLYYVRKYIIDEKIYSYKIDDKIFFDSNQFEMFDELKLNWKIVQQEAKHILENSPKLEMTRTYEDWKDSQDYMNTIMDKHGWIRSWKSPEQTKEENGNGNYDWLNYGLFYDGVEFNQNIMQCPETYKILEKMKDKINIAGFSYMKGKSMIQKHTDSTGIIFHSLAFHLGLIIPEPYSTCQLIINDGYKNYSYTETPGGTVIFDGTYEHYAYNQSNEDRVILYIDFKI
jgi:beta-hydroxylase